MRMLLFRLISTVVSISRDSYRRERAIYQKKTEHTFIHPNEKDVSTIDFFIY